MKKDELIRRLNEDLAGEPSAIIQYITYAAKATGPYRPQLSQFFLAEVADEAYGDKGLAVQLEDMVRDESGHVEETERILLDWPL